MKRYFYLLFVIALLASCQTTTHDNHEKYSIEQFYKNINIYGGAFSADETKLLITSNQTGIYNLWEIDLKSGERKALTESEDQSRYAITYFPNDNRILFSSDGDGDEISHIWVRDLDGSIKDITPWEGVKSSFYGWRRYSHSFYFECNKRDKRFMDLYEMDIDNFMPKLIYQNEKGLDISLLSPNQQFAVLTKSLTTSSNKMFIKDLQSGKSTEISVTKANYKPQFFDIKSQNFYYLTNEGSEFTYLVEYNIEKDEKKVVWKEDWDIWYAYNSYNEKYRVIGVNEDARTAIRVIDNSTGKPIELPDFGDQSIKGIKISKSEQLMRLSVGSSKSPSNTYLYNFKNKKLKQLTTTLNEEINPDHLVEGKVIRYKSFDGLEIPAILYRPKQANAKNKVPVMVWVHGGPGGQSRASYFALIQYMVNQGYGIIAVNNRGSSGYGKTFYQLDDQKHGEDDLQDCIKAKDYLATLNWVDTDKIGIIGGSYGGYMVMAALTFTSDTFAVGVNIFGVTNWLRTLKSIPPYWESFRSALYAEMGDPTTADSVRLHRISPLFHAHNVTKPLMVLQGANDPRVLQVESDEIVKAVKANNVPVEYVLFPDEGHGFVKKENEISGYSKIVQFLDKHLKK
ncbi:S9 family peptidase [Prolixibacteraceae bacterium JC049]|nr:S9 family peptidase [Prolixibacteraceae bacterium JC049]